MQNRQLRAAQINHVDNGTMQVQVTSAVGMVPVEDARVTISYTGDPESKLEQISTDADGQSEVLTLAAPPLEYSMEPEQPVQPYAEYTVEVEAEGYQPVNRIAKPFAVDGIEIPGRTYHKLACVVNTIHIVDKHVYIIPACVDMVGYILISGQAVCIGLKPFLN